MLLESVKHASSCFVTLTYNDLTIPHGSTLVTDDPKNWLKRLRQALYPDKIRYYLVGEYGDKTYRPHYHAAIFGLNQELGGGIDGRRGLVALTWKNGITHVGDLSKDSAGYICGYVTKKMTKKTDPRLLGKYPEFSRMSRRPGLGASAMKDVAGAYEEYLKAETFTTGTFPAVLQYGKKKMPLGRYLKRVLRQELGYGKELTSEEIQAFGTKMRGMFEAEKETSKQEKRKIKYIESIDKQRIKSLESRFKIYDKKGEL